MRPITLGRNKRKLPNGDGKTMQAIAMLAIIVK